MKYLITIIVGLVVLAVIGAAIGEDESATTQAAKASESAPVAQNPHLTKSRGDVDPHRNPYADKAKAEPESEVYAPGKPKLTLEEKLANEAESGDGGAISGAIGDPTPEPEPAPEPEPEPEPVKPTMTSSQENAIGSAESYIDTMPFSKEGLVKQLKFEKFSEADARFAVNHIDVNWNAEAVESAEHYLETMPFSKPELIDQLEFEGFTAAQAQHGANQAY